MTRTHHASAVKPPSTSTATLRLASRRGPSLLLALAGLLLFDGCAASPPRGSPALLPGTAAGGSGPFSEKAADVFQGVQEASGLKRNAWHPAGTALSPEQAHQLLEELARTPVTRHGFAPRRVLSWLLREVLRGDERVEYADLQWRTERFGTLVLIRPDGYLVTALSGTPLQRMGSVQLVEGEWKVGQFGVGDFYFSRDGVFYPVNEALRCVDGPPLGELGLGRDPFNAALDGAQEALEEMAKALAHSLLHPIRAVEDLTQLPTSVARLIASSPEYFARYGAMSREEQIREAARLSTHVLTMLGGGEATAGSVGHLGAELPELSLTASGELLLDGVARPAGTRATLELAPGALSVLHMAGSGQGSPGGAGGKKSKSAPATATRAPGHWVYKKPTTESARARDYQEQITGRPDWYVYRVDEVEFDGFNGKELLEAKGPGYSSFFDADGTPKYWYVNSGKFGAMMNQAREQSQLARRLGLPLAWHVADAKVAEFLQSSFKTRGWTNIAVHFTPPVQ